MNTQACSAFAGHKRIAHGALAEVALKVKDYLERHKDSSILVFDDASAKPIDLDLRGNARTITQRYQVVADDEIQPEKKSGPGRPKLGVIAREVTLLPRHWDWLASQPGGASVTLRKLVEEAKAKNHKRDQIRLAQEAAHRFMSALAGDLPGYEEALRAFYAKKFETFSKLIDSWPKDVRDYVQQLAAPVTGA
ncbi:MAG: DUF2239 family protein [Bdellovibrionia bacterium]